MSTAAIAVPVEIGSRRKVHLVPRAENVCRECREPILRISSAKDDIWIHRGRAGGTAYAHPARPQGGVR